MKFKGFFTSYWALCKESFVWLKDYWFLYIIITLLLATLFTLPQLIDLYKWNKRVKELDAEDFG